MVLIPENDPTKSKGKLLKSSEIDELRPCKGVKPLSNHIFYLDIKNPQLSTKIESKIKQLGGNVNLFLGDDVTHVITDIISADSCSSSNLQSTLSSSFHSSTHSLESSVSPSVSKQTTTGGIKRLSGPRSRADAMLERAQCNLDISRSPLQVARSRYIPVWNVEKILQHLNKISNASILDTKIDTSAGCTKLLGPHVKVESVKGDFRPTYKYFRSWPVLDVLGEFGTCPFKVSKNLFENSMHGRTAIVDSVNDNSSSDSKQQADKTDQNSSTFCMELKKMARKTRQRTRHKESQSLQCGYCEICHIDYPDLPTHLQSAIHQNYVRQKSNFICLDKLINSEANVDSFLKQNSKRCLRSRDLGSLKNSYDESSNQSEITPIQSTESNCEMTTKCIDHNKRCLRSFFKPHDSHAKPSYNDSFDTNDLNMSPSYSEAISDDTVEKLSINKRCLRSQDVNNVKNSSEATFNQGESYYKSFRKNGDRSTPEANSSRLRSRINSTLDATIENTSNPSGLKANQEAKNLKIGSNSQDHCPRRSNMKQNISASPSYKIVGSKSKVKEQESRSDKKSTGLVVKFKRIRQSELLVLSDEAENFMFPKRDDTSDSESEDDEKINGHDKNGRMDNGGMDMVCDNSDSDTNEDNIKLSEIRNKQRFPLNPTQPDNSVGDRVGLINDLSAEDLNEFKFAFECLNNDLWCHTYRRKDLNKEIKFESYRIGIGSKKFKLPYEMGTLPPLKPNCCKLNIWPDAPSVPEKKIRKRKKHLAALSGKSRKSPREHASTLASMVQLRKKEELDALAMIKEESCSTETSDNSESFQQLDTLLSAFNDQKMFADIEDILEGGLSFNARYEPSMDNLIESLGESAVLKGLPTPVLLDTCDSENPSSVSNVCGDKRENDLDAEDINKLTFSFECTPNELWYHTYKRKDENKELKFLNSKPKNGGRRYKLPYELGPLPPLKPNCCKLNTSNGNGSVVKRKMKRKKRLLLTNRKCRKSPREHAILASFVKIRKNQEMNIEDSKAEDEITTDVTESNASNVCVNSVQHLDVMLSDLCNDKTCFDVKDILEEGISFNVRYEPTVNNLLETLEESTVLENLKFQSQIIKHDRRKKRKNNKTGWPKKKKFLPRTTTNKIPKDTFVNAATQTNTCEITNDEIVLSIPVTDNSVNIVELSSEPLVVCGDHSCSSGKENILCENSDIFVECMMKTNSSINSDNEPNKTERLLENTSIDEQQNSSHSDPNKMVTLGKCDVNKIVSNNICTVDDASVVSDDKRFQPYVCVHKMDEPHNSTKNVQSDGKKKKISKSQVSPICTLSPRKLRAPRGKWYRER